MMASNRRDVLEHVWVLLTLGGKAAVCFTSTVAWSMPAELLDILTFPHGGARHPHKHGIKRKTSSVLLPFPTLCGVVLPSSLLVLLPPSFCAVLPSCSSLGWCCSPSHPPFRWCCFPLGGGAAFPVSLWVVLRSQSPHGWCCGPPSLFGSDAAFLALLWSAAVLSLHPFSGGVIFACVVFEKQWERRAANRTFSFHVWSSECEVRCLRCCPHGRAGHK